MEHLSPKVVWVSFIGVFMGIPIGLLVAIFLAAFMLVAESGEGVSIEFGNLFRALSGLGATTLVSLTFGWAIVVYTYSYLSYKAYRFQFTDKYLLAESGILYKSSIVIPYEKVQKVSINRGPMERLFNISVLVIRTASEATPSRRGVSLAIAPHRADELKGKLVKLIHKVSE